MDPQVDPYTMVFLPSNDDKLGSFSLNPARTHVGVHPKGKGYAPTEVPINATYEHLMIAFQHTSSGRTKPGVKGYLEAHIAANVSQI
jgi:hypothetical protein